MSHAAPRTAPLARRRLLALLGISPQVRRGRFAPPAVHHAAAGGPILVLVEDASAMAHPLLRAILAGVGLAPDAVRVAGAPLPEGARVCLALGEVGVGALVTAPGVAELASDPGAKRALWRSLRPFLREV